jgi:hypothetical protein
LGGLRPVLVFFAISRGSFVFGTGVVSNLKIPLCFHTSAILIFFEQFYDDTKKSLASIPDLCVLDAKNGFLIQFIKILLSKFYINF